ncbi:helix-turn-helix domain-containing protein [Paenibacillus senegalensis]|uniref:helix-turn-helix domain-containing protein n=1 Tax=Paenibacillus senegalensis TaxID=1465766 RepID=UPI0002885F7B|nr:helix-turn-helix domain-containing protein [Paenibacillus senegalensis]
MNYIKEINAFYDWLESNPLPSEAIALWHALMSICNKAGWLSEFTVANSTLQAKAGLSRKQLDRWRSNLMEYGRITYQKSNKVNEAGKYTLISFNSPIVQNGIQNGTQEGTQNDTQKGAQDDLQTLPIVQNGTQNDTQNGAQNGHIIKLNKTKEDIYVIFEFWKNSGLKKHPKITPQIEQQCKWKIEKYGTDRLLESITNYAKILHNENYVLDTKWGLDTFLERNHFEKFFSENDPYSFYPRNKRQPQTGPHLELVVPTKEERDFLEQVYEQQRIRNQQKRA